MKRRWSFKEERSLRGECKALILQMRKGHWSQATYLDYRERLFKQPRWERLTLSTLREARAYLAGMLDLVESTDISWAHWSEAEGRYIPLAEWHARGLPYLDMDPKRSTFVWVGSNDKWYPCEADRPVNVPEQLGGL